MTKAAEELRAWIDLLPGQSFFFTDEIPEWESSLRFTLGRIAADAEHPVMRVSHGFYCKRWHQDWPAEHQIDYVSTRRAALHFAGAGAGAANLNALNLVGWTAQHPALKDICCSCRPPPSPWGHTRFVQRLNERRNDLTWAEITLLEALRLFELSDLDWGDAVGVISSGDYLGRLRGGAEVDSERVLWASEGETRQPRTFHDRARELCSVIPPHDSFNAWRSRTADM